MSNSVVTIQQPQMQYDYYQINPPQHAEAAYQPNQGDKFPPVATVPSRSPSGEIIVMMTTLFNRNPAGIGQMELVDYNSLIRLNGGTFPTPDRAQQIINQHPDIVRAHLSGTMPFLAEVICGPNAPVTVRPLTGGAMTKAVSEEDFNAMGGQPAI